MKKSIICALLATAICTVTNASEFTSLETSTQQSTVTYSAPSEYMILIPETITADGSRHKFVASKMDLRDGEHVEISASMSDEDGGIQMFTNSGKWMLAKFHLANGDYRRGNVISVFENGMTESLEEFYITAEQTEGAGDYYGTISFDISLVRD